MKIDATLRALVMGVTSLTILAGAAGAHDPVLKACKKRGTPVTLVIHTGVGNGWTVNTIPAVQVSNPAWANTAPAKWIGLAGGNGPGTMTYKVNFGIVGAHGAMTVAAHWATDNCGTTLTGGTGVAASTGACYSAPSPDGRDFMYYNHNTTASFGAADGSAPNSSITFVTANQSGTPAGMAGKFTITAECDR